MFDTKLREIRNLSSLKGSINCIINKNIVSESDETTNNFGAEYSIKTFQKTSREELFLISFPTNPRANGTINEIIAMLDAIIVKSHSPN